jgi:hypothetical protein
MLGHGPQAEDAIQDAFLIALRSIDRLREPEAVTGWLHGILRNVCLRQLRERRGEIFFDDVGILGKASSEPYAEETIDRLATREWVLPAPKVRVVLDPLTVPLVGFKPTRCSLRPSEYSTSHWDVKTTSHKPRSRRL